MKQKAFSCFCTDEKLELSRENAKKNKQPYRYDGGCYALSDADVIDNETPFTVRIQAPQENIQFTDLIKGDFDYKPYDVDSFIILRKDKMPTYNFACAIDDMLYDISTVIRGEDQLPNTPKQIHIRQSLGYKKQINYIHLPLILNSQTGKKMSKRDDSSSIAWLISEGFLPIAIANYLVLLGNNTPTEIFTLEEAVEWFDVKKLSKSQAKFDLDKLKFINREHMKLLDNMRFSKLLGYADEDFGILAKIYIEETDSIQEIKQRIDAILAPKETPKEFEKEYLKIKQCMQNAPFIHDFTQLKKYIADQTGLEEKSLLKPLRYILTGEFNGPNLSDVYPLIRNYLGEIIK
ncbi:MAG: glutamate--tRNA ligase, partial [Campylobacterota bacterium]|nr:glutamate--tRNA ligase [Campylobacterota bacterium]